MVCRVRRLAGTVLAGASIALGAATLWGAQPAPGPMRALQKLAEKQGHPAAGAKALNHLGHSVPPDIEAAAAGITPEALQKAIEQRGSLATRLETLRGRSLSDEQRELLAEAEQSYARTQQTLRSQYVQQAVIVTGLPAGKVRPILLRGTTSRNIGQGLIAELEKLLGRALTAADVEQLRFARQSLLASARSEREAFARQIARIANIPFSVALVLTR